MANKKRISVNMIESVMSGEENKTIEWWGLEISVRKTIGFEEMVEFVNETVNSCFSENGAYNPEAKDFAFRLNIVEKYTDIRLPDNVEAQYLFAFGTDVIDEIIGFVNHRQLDSMIAAIDEKISNRARANIEQVMKRIQDISSAIDEVQTQMTEQLSAALDGVDPSDIAKLAGSMAGDKLDEKKIVEAYLEHSYGTAEVGA